MASIKLAGLKEIQPHIVEGDLNPRVLEEEDYLYKDIQLDLEIGDTIGNFPITKGKGISDIKDLRNIQDIKQSLLNIFNTVPGQKLLNPYLGLNLSKYLFDPINAQTADLIARSIYLGLPAQEPRITITHLSVIGSIDEGIYDVQFGIQYRDKQIEEVVFKGTLSQEGMDLSF